MIRNSLICKLINVQASMKENKEKKIKNCDEISKLIKAFPKVVHWISKELERYRFSLISAGHFPLSALFPLPIFTY